MNDTPPPAARHDAGRRADLSGKSAELRVADMYAQAGYELTHERWRGQGGEIDLIFALGDLVIFTEVKKSRSREMAISRLTARQMKRIHAAASEYLATTPKGQLSDVRFDLAVMDAQGQIEIIENAFGHF